MDKKVTITIIDIRTTWSKWLRNIFATFLLVIVPISLGVVADSTAMQWVGFAFASMTVISIARSQLGEKTVYSITEARALLDELEVDHD